jgi:ABC-type bacteriocin/lantibiotic exporter with double-glycine peptidase domain
MMKSMTSHGVPRGQADHAAHHDGDHSSHEIPVVRLIRLFSQERSDLWVLVTYTVIAGLMALAVPLATQALVNTIAAGVLVQPLIVLTVLVLIGMLCAGFLQLLRLVLVERLQQRVFARVALDIAERMVRVRTSSLRGEYAPELVNRFFDVLTLQKTLAKLLVDGLASALQAFVGLILLAVYSPLLLGFDVFVLLFIAFIIGILGWNGLTSSIDESAEKYKVADWLEELARCHTSLKMHGDRRYLIDRADNAVVRYILGRREHFKVFWRQSAGSYIFQALASAGVLAIGGWLVINRQLTLGQLVAAQIIVVSVLASLEKLVRQAEELFDLLTSMEKVGHVTDLPMEREGGHKLPETSEQGLPVVCRGVRFAYNPGDEVLAGLSLDLKPGDRVSLVGASGAGKSTLAALICGLEEPSHGTVEVGGIEVRAMDLSSLRRAVTLVGYTNEIFNGTIEDNIRVGREHVTHQDIRWALEIAQLTDDIAQMPGGTSTLLVSAGQNLSRGQAQRLLIARAIAGRPRLLVLDEAFTGIDERTTMKILDAIYAPENVWTIIDISHEAEVVVRSNRIHVLADGRIVESGTAEKLAKKNNGEFAALFPYLSSQLRWHRRPASRAVKPVKAVKRIKKVKTEAASNAV